MMPSTTKRRATKRTTVTAASVTVRARISPEKAKMLRKLAKEKGTTESELIREAIDLLDRRERRAHAIAGLIALIPEKIPTKDEYAARFGKW